MSRVYLHILHGHKVVSVTIDFCVHFTYVKITKFGAKISYFSRHIFCIFNIWHQKYQFSVKHYVRTEHGDIHWIVLPKFLTC
jgi:hypothetical protein